MSGASTTPAWSTATYPATTTINRLLYSSAANVVAGLATANSSVLITSAAGVPSISNTLPATVQGNITTVGTLTAGTWNATTITLAHGGTGAALTASNGGIIYSNASTLAVLAGTATANQVLLSGASTTPAWSTATYPTTTTINQLLYSSAGNTIAGLTTANNGVLITSSGGVPSISSTLPSAVQGNITTVGTITSGTWNGGIIPLAYGGTNANLTATAGGSVYSTGSASAITAAGTTGQILYSNGASAPTWNNVPSITTTLQQAYNNNGSSPTTIGISSGNGPLLVYNYNTTSLQQVFGVSGYSASPTYGNYFAIYETGSATQNAIIGLNASAPTINAVNSIALGTSATANVTNGFAFGTTAVSSANYAIALGANTLASGAKSIAIGGDGTASKGAQSTASQTIAIGDISIASSNYSIAIGANSTASTGTNAIAIGGDTTTGASATNTNAIAIGYASTASGTNSAVIGASSTASSANSQSYGQNITNSQSGTVIMSDGVATNPTGTATSELILSYANGVEIIGNTTSSTRVNYASGTVNNSPTWLIQQSQWNITGVG